MSESMAAKRSAEAVVLVGAPDEWPEELVGCITRQGYAALRIGDLIAAPAFLRNGAVKALLVGARPFGAKELLILRECRQLSPGTAIVVITTRPTQPDLKRAFESGATAFLSWPAPNHVVRQALASGGFPEGERRSDGKQ